MLVSYRRRSFCTALALLAGPLPPSAQIASAQRAEPAPVRCSPLVGEAWSIVWGVYLDPAYNGVDWAALEPAPGALCTGSTPHEQVRALLARLDDPAVRLVPAAQVDAFLAEMAGEAHVGVGLRELLSLDADERTGLLTVVTPVPDGPAARAGVRTGDVIQSIGGVRADTMDLARAMAALRGPEGSRVEVSIRRGRDIEAVSLRRERVEPPPPVTVRLRSGDGGGPIAYLRLPEFTAGLPAALRDALSAAAAADAVGIILDVRDNPGGVVPALLGAAELFLEPGRTIARVRSRPGADTAFASAAEAATSLPAVVLVNGGTASAAEALAGALQAAGRAVVVGERTFGKGLAHTASPLSDGSLVLAPAGRLQTPHGRDILRQGIAPDVSVAAPPLTRLMPDLEHDPVYRVAVTQLSADGGAPAATRRRATRTEPGHCPCQPHRC